MSKLLSNHKKHNTTAVSICPKEVVYKMKEQISSLIRECENMDNEFIAITKSGESRTL
jgi:hypothetical protein